MILLGISGKKGVGKDLLSSILAKKYGFINLPFAGELKEAVRRDFGLTKEHTDGKLKESPVACYKRLTPEIKGSLDISVPWTPREIMIEYGQFFRRFDPLWWVKKTFDKIDTILSNKQTAHYPGDLRITVSDVRFRNEANAIKEKGGIVVRLNRPQELNIYPYPSTDVSEIDLDHYPSFDLELPEEYNKVPEDLEKFADIIIKYVEVQSVGNSR